jgi:hypothetical protein
MMCIVPWCKMIGGLRGRCDEQTVSAQQGGRGRRVRDERTTRSGTWTIIRCGRPVCWYEPSPTPPPSNRDRSAIFRMGLENFEGGLLDPLRRHSVQPKYVDEFVRPLLSE